MSMIPIASASGTIGTATFNNIPAGFTHLQIRVFGRDGGTGFPQDIYMRFNGDTGNNYARHRLTGDGANASSLGQTALSYAFGGFAPVAASLANVGAVSIIDILDYANTNKNKTTRVINGVDLNGSGNVGLFSSVWLNTNAITSIEVGFATGTGVAGNRFDLYGIATSSATGA